MVTTMIGMAYVELLHGLYTAHAGVAPAAEELVKSLREDFGQLVAQQEREPIAAEESAAR